MSIRLVIIGAGGHGQVVADAALRAGDREDDVVVVGFVDDAPELVGRCRLGVKVLGPLSALERVEHDAVILAIGNNGVRRTIYEQLRTRGERFVSVVHPSSVIGRDVIVRPGSFVAAGVVVNPGTVIGHNCILNTACSIDHHNAIGDHVHVASGVHTGGDVEIGEGVLLGIGSIVMPQRRVGAWATIAAGACVTQFVPPGLTVAGVPARVLARGAA